VQFAYWECGTWIEDENVFDLRENEHKMVACVGATAAEFDPSGKGCGRGILIL
jgi:hypothetical protein